MNLKYRVAIFMALFAILAMSMRNRVASGQAPAAVTGITLQPAGSGLASPVHITHAGDGSGRIFVVQQTGEVFIIQDGIKQAAPFLDIHTQVSCCLERGLLSIAFSPAYPTRPYFYVNYTDTAGNTVVSRFTAAAGAGTADPASEVIVFQAAQPDTNHNGGQIAFGPDGFLYIGMGDGGGSGDPQSRAQNPADILGKMLRIDVESSGCTLSPPNQPRNFCIPPSNPFVQTAGHQPEIWALGLRNPWRFSFDRLTGALFVADVGQGQREEVNYQPAASPGGENYGWNVLEGSLCFSPSTGCTPPPGYSPPGFEYAHTLGRCSVTGGFVYRGPLYPGLYGIYLYADYCTGEIWGLDPSAGWQNQLLLDAPFNITTFGEDEAGFLYVSDYNAGILYRIHADIPGPNASYLPILMR